MEGHKVKDTHNYWWWERRPFFKVDISFFLQVEGEGVAVTFKTIQHKEVKRKNSQLTCSVAPEHRNHTGRWKGVSSRSQGLTGHRAFPLRRAQLLLKTVGRAVLSFLHRPEEERFACLTLS